MRALLATVLLAPLFLSGCIIRGDMHDDDEPRRIGGDGGSGGGSLGDLRFTVLLDGNPCESVPEVAGLHVLLEGEATVDDRQLCPPSGTELVIPALPDGLYAFRIEALGADDAVLYAANGTATIAGPDDTSLTADLAPVGGGGGPLGVITFLWSFGGASCADAGIAEVHLVAGAFDGVVPCETTGVDGVSVEGLAAGATAFTATGLDVLGGARYEARGTMVVPATGEETVSVDLAALPETVELVWTFEGQGSCVLAGVSDVTVSISAGETAIYAGTHACRDGAALVHGLAPGSYAADLRALDATGQLVYEARAAELVVEAGGGRVVVDLAAP